MESFLLSKGFTHCHSDPIVYIQRLGDEILILVLYVDDLILTSSLSSMLQDVKRVLMDQFEMTNFGLLHYFLGLQIDQSPTGIFVYQQKYALDMLCRFHMLDCKASPTLFQSGVTLSTSYSSPLVDATLYRQLVGSLLYLTHTCLDLSFAVGLVSQFSQDPHETYWQAARHILHYIQGTLMYGIHYTLGTSHIIGYTDSDWAGDVDDRKSTSSFVFYLGSGPIPWSCKKQHA